MSKSFWYCKCKWRTFRDLVAQLLSGEGSHESHSSWASVLFLSQLSVTSKEICEFKSHVVFGGCPADLQGAVPYQIPGHGQWVPAVSLGFLGTSLSLHLPPQSCAYSFFIEWLSTIKHPVARCLLSVLERRLICCGGRVICPVLFVLFLIVSSTFPSYQLQSIFICFWGFSL